MLSCTAGPLCANDPAKTPTRVTLQLDYEPEGVVESVGSALNVPERRMQGDLERFKEFIESRGNESGAWRGDIAAPPTA